MRLTALTSRTVSPVCALSLGVSLVVARAVSVAASRSSAPGLVASW
jgi:hypothetical protein